MKREQIIEFTKHVQSEFCWYLYAHEYPVLGSSDTLRYDFSYCCKLASNIISSYLSVHTGYVAKSIMTTRLPYDHCWCECKGLDIAIDYTGLQHNLSPEHAKMFTNHEVTRDIFDDVLSKTEIAYSIRDFFFRQAGFFTIEIENHALNEAKAIKGDPWALNEFMNYVVNACNSLQNNSSVMDY